MNEIFAIEPTAFEDDRDLNYLLANFGFHEGRFVADYPNKWFKLACEHLDTLSLPSLKRKRAGELLDKYKKNCLVPVGRGFLPEQTWLENARQLKQQELVADVIVAREHAGEFQSPDIDRDYFFRWGGRQADVLSNADGYAQAAAMLLRMSHEVAIIDPYFYRLGPRYQKVMEKFSEVATTGKCRRFIVYTQEGKNIGSLDYVEREARKVFELVRQRGISVTLVVVRDTEHVEEDNHARFLVSTKGAMQFDRGFDEEAIPRLRKVAVLDPPLHDKLCRQYLDEQSAIRHILRIEIKGENL